MCRDSRLIAAPEFDHPNPVCARTGCVLKEDGKPECAQGACAAYKPTPTPSITVGTQVRLTGVVEPDPAEGGGGIYLRTAGGHSVYLNSSAKEDIEVIRQPFKRGEVVYHVGDKDSEPRTVVTDEAEGFVLLSRHVHGTETLEWDATTFERRP